MSDYMNEPAIRTETGKRPLLFSQYPSSDVLAEMRAVLTDEHRARSIWQAQLGLDAATVSVIFCAMQRDWTGLWRRFGFEVDCLSAVPIGRHDSIATLLETNAGLAEEIHAFEQKWARYIPARLTRAS